MARALPYRHPWLFSAVPALFLALLPAVRPHAHDHHPAVTAVLIFVGVILLMRLAFLAFSAR
jgi:hypothetical protein